MMRKHGSRYSQYKYEKPNRAGITRHYDLLAQKQQDIYGLKRPRLLG
jgi:hypothetical protein